MNIPEWVMWAAGVWFIVRIAVEVMTLGEGWALLQKAKERYDEGQHKSGKHEK